MEPFELAFDLASSNENMTFESNFQMLQNAKCYLASNIFSNDFFFLETNNYAVVFTFLLQNSVSIV